MMKKNLLFTSLCLFFTIANWAQTFEKNNVIIDAYYGFPNWNTILNNNQTNGISSSLPVSVNGFGPIGVKGEFMITDKIGIGLDASYNRSEAVETITNYDYINGEIVNLTITSKTRKIGGIATFNFHPIEADIFDLAIVAGIGYSNRKFDTEFSSIPFSETYVGYNYFTSDNNFLGATRIIFPVVLKIGVTMRWFISDNFGFNLSVSGVHGGVLNGGITAKF